MLNRLPYNTIETLAANGDGAGWLRWLLGLERVDPTASEAIFGWGHELPVWVWLLIALAAVALAGFSYRRILGRRAGRITLAVTRAAILMLIAVLLAKPMLVLPDENVEPDRVLMLLDQSASMTVQDAPASDNATEVSGEGNRSRHQQLQDLLAEHGEAWSQLAEEHEVDWLGFSERLVPLGGPTGLPEPTGDATALRSALQRAVRRAAGKPVSAVVVFSDGRSSESMGPEAYRLLQQIGASVWSVPLGAEDAPLDLSIQRTDAPDRAFVDDTVPITVTVGRSSDPNQEETGDDNAPVPPDTMVRLIDEATGETLDEKPVSAFDEPVRLMHTPKAAGEVTWRLELTSSASELIQRNNEQSLDLELVDRPIRLLYIEGYPRWEYRYLKNLLVREKSVESSIMLISADRSFAQEGDVPLQRLPRTEEELRPYDVIIIGDAPASFFSSEQFRLIKQQVSAGGAGLMWLAGPRYNPGTYAASPLADALPIDTGSEMRRLPAPIDVERTPTAGALGVLRLRDPQAEDQDSLWPEDLPSLKWAQAIDSMKPATEALAADAASGQPLVVRMRYGAGQALFAATDEIWRWRYGRGDLYVQQYWMQLVRLLARSRLQSGSGDDQRARLSVSHRRATTGQTLVVELAIVDQTLLENPPERIELEVAPADDGEAGPADRGGRRRITLTATDREGRYRGLWSPRVPGERELKVVSGPLADMGLSRAVTVQRADDELRYPATDHKLLAELAERTDGRVLNPANLGELPSQVPKLARITATDISEPLTHSPLAFAVLLVLLSGEWVGRRLLGLA